MEQPTIDIRLADCRDLLADLEDNSIDSCVMDPPYEIGLLGKKWDSSGITYQPAVWEGLLRVLKPGAHVCAFSASRTYHHLAVAAENAGFEVRDMIEWCYGTGYAAGNVVAKNVLSALEEPPADLLERLDGFGTRLKPAHEPILLARKPLCGKVVDNLLEYGTGGINIDGCRVPFVSEKDESSHSAHVEQIRIHGGMMSGDWMNDRTDYSKVSPTNPLGRWPTNLIHDGSPEVMKVFDRVGKRKGMSGGGKHSEGYQGTMFGSVDSTHTVRNDDGSAARFFYCAKPSHREKEAGLESLPATGGATNVGRREGSAGAANAGAGSGRTKREVRNVHPTVKPIELMRYLARLVTPPRGRVIDLFTGSGTTAVACLLECLDFVGSEIDSRYIEIAKLRLEHWRNSENCPRR